MSRYGTTRWGVVGAVWGVETRTPTYPDDAAQGITNIRPTRPAYSRFLLNRMGGAHLDTVACATKTPWPGLNGKGVRNWEVARPHHVPQAHRTGGHAPLLPGPADILNMQTYGQTYVSLRGRLADVLARLTG
jgi:hypothetical protein